MKIEGEIADLVREAAVLGFVQGGVWGKSVAFVEKGRIREGYPKDSAIVREVLKMAHRMPETFPSLAQADLEGLTGEQIWAEDTAAANEVVKALMLQRDEAAIKDLRADFVEYLREQYGRTCEFLLIVEHAKEHLGYQPSGDELEAIYQEVVKD